VAGAADAAWAQKDDKREKARERIRAIVVTQLIEKLDLDDKTAAKLMPILEKAQDEGAAIQRDNRAIRQELRRLHRGRANAKDADVNKLIDRLVENREKAHKVESGMIAEARKILKPMQAARLVVVLPRIKARIAAEIRKAVEGKRGGAGTGDDPDMSDPEDDEEF
jgi:hypothetical protein